MCSPGLAHERLTPTNCDDLLFDDVLWVQNARRDHFDFIDKMRERDVDVVELHNVLTETMASADAKTWLLDRKIVPNEVGLGLVDDTRGFLDSLPPRRLAELLIGGMSTRDLPAEIQSGYRALAREAAGVTEYLMPPLPNTLYTRDTTCWIYQGVTLNPLFWPARHDETHVDEGDLPVPPRLRGFAGLVGRPGGDVWDGLHRGRRRPRPREGRRHHRDERANIAPGHHPGGGQSCSRRGAATQVIVAGMPKLRAAMHLDTIFTFADRDVVTLYPDIVDALQTFVLHPSDGDPGVEVEEATKPFVEVVAAALGLDNCAWWKPVARNTIRSASSGTAATTWSPSNQAWCSPTTATPTPTHSCARPV